MRNAGTPVLKTLANGVRLLAIPLPHVQSASVGVFLRVGSRDETPETSGVSRGYVAGGGPGFTKSADV